MNNVKVSFKTALNQINLENIILATSSAIP